MYYITACCGRRATIGISSEPCALVCALARRAPRLIWTIKVIRLRYRLVCTRASRSAELSEIFYELLRGATGTVSLLFSLSLSLSLGEIKRVSANVKAQFPADGYELMEDARGRVSSFTPRQMPAFAFLISSSPPSSSSSSPAGRDDAGGTAREAFPPCR